MDFDRKDDTSKDRRNDKNLPKRKDKRREKVIRPRPERINKERLYPQIHQAVGPIPSKPPLILTKQSNEKQDDATSTPPVILAIQKREPAADSQPQSSPAATDTPGAAQNISIKLNELSISGDLDKSKKENYHSKVNDQRDSSFQQYVKIPKVGKLPNNSIEIINENFVWSDKALEVLSDRQDYMVIGTVGLQGAGKSTIMSLIADGSLDVYKERDYKFKPQTKENNELNCHQTNGVSLGITEERILLLDTQPLLSPSVLEQLLRHERKIPSELSTAELCLDMQALQLLTFLFTVCHVVVVVQDNFFDSSLFRLISTAEMLKPSSVAQSSSDCASTPAEDLDEYHPHVVFVYNGVNDACFEPSNVEMYCMVLDRLMEHSRLKIADGVSSLDDGCLPCGKLDSMQAYKDLNLFMLPRFEEKLDNNDENKLTGRRFKGHPSFQALVPFLRSNILSVSRRQGLTHHTLTERNWFHYAFRTWDSIKKSNILAEYQRLLTS